MKARRLSALLALALTIAVTGCAPAGSGVTQVTTSVPTATVGTATPSPIPSDTPTPTITPTPAPVVRTGAILGLDFEPTRPERNIYGVRSDVVMLYQISDPWDGPATLTLISLPRDLWLQVPCSPLDPALEGNDRINAAWAYGKFDCFIQTIETNFPIDINAPTVAVNFDGFINIVKRFGGLDITPTETYTDWCGSYHGTDGEHGYYVTWEAGKTYHMDAYRLLCYARARHGASDGDLDRNRRHLEIMQAALDQWPAQVFDTNNPLDMAAEVKALFDTVRSAYETNKPFTAFTFLLKYAVPYSRGEMEIRTISMAIEQEVDFYRTPIYNASVLKPRVDLYNWMGCELAFDGGQPCTGMHLLTPTPEH